MGTRPETGDQGDGQARSKIQKQQVVLFVQQQAEEADFAQALCRPAPFAGESKVWERGGQGSDHASERLGPRATAFREK